MGEKEKNASNSSQFTEPLRIPEITRHVGPRLVDHLGIDTAIGIVDVFADTNVLRAYFAQQYMTVFPNIDSGNLNDHLDRLAIAFGKRTSSETIRSLVEEALIHKGYSQKHIKRELDSYRYAEWFNLAYSMGRSPSGLYWRGEHVKLLYLNLPRMISKKKNPYNSVQTTWSHEVQHLLDDLHPTHNKKIQEDQVKMLGVTLATTVVCCTYFESAILRSFDKMNTLGEKMFLVSFGTADAVLFGLVGGNLGMTAYRKFFHRYENRASTAALNELFPIQEALTIQVRP